MDSVTDATYPRKPQRGGNVRCRELPGVSRNSEPCRRSLRSPVMSFRPVRLGLVGCRDEVDSGQSFATGSEATGEDF